MDREIIVNISDIKPIQDLAIKEEATETAQRLERLVARAQREIRFGGRMPRMGGPVPQSGTRPPRLRGRDVETSEDLESSEQ